MAKGLSARSCNPLGTSHKYMNTPVDLRFALNAISRYITNEFERTARADYSIITEQGANVGNGAMNCSD